MRLSFPLRSPTEIRTALGEGGAVVKRFRTERVPRFGVVSWTQVARAIPNQEITVVDRFDDGALYPRVERVDCYGRGRQVLNPSAGRPNPLDRSHFRRYRTVPPGGRRQSASSRCGERPALGRHIGRFIKEGNVITFSGRVRHRGATDPGWREVGRGPIPTEDRASAHAERTIPNPGQRTYRFSYRFSKALTSDALFHFRVKVRNEGNWPFKGIASSGRGRRSRHGGGWPQRLGGLVFAAEVRRPSHGTVVAYLALFVALRR